MLNQSHLSRIENILNIHNTDVDLTFINDISRAYRDNDLTLLISTIATLFKNISSFKKSIPDIIKYLKEENNHDLIYILSNQKYKSKLLKNILHLAKDNVENFDALLDSYNSNQVASKSALLNAIDSLSILNKDSTVVIWGSWFGSILIPKLAPKVKRVVCIDLDNEPLQIAKNRLFNNYKNIDYVCDDIFKKYRDVYLTTNLIINTSCEHMTSMKEWKWFQKGAVSTDSQRKHKFISPKLSDKCYFAFQSNNMFDIEGHINCVNSLEEFKEQLPARAEVLFEEEVEDTRGTRYMLVGKFNPL